MHSLARNEQTNARLVKDFINKVYDETPTYEQLLEDNLISGTQLLEKAVSNVDNISMCPIGYHRDLVDDSDVKTVTVQENTSFKKKCLKSGVYKKYKSITHIAPIRDVDKKIGLLRVIVYNPFSEKYHFFRIPPSAKLGIKHLKITFDRTTNLPLGKYSKFEVSNFEEVSTRLTLNEQVDTIICNVDKKNINSQIDNLIATVSGDLILSTFS